MNEKFKPNLKIYAIIKFNKNPQHKYKRVPKLEENKNTF